jgi:LacI family transcriptional regulator/LacI family repressor for deo operon, udp, cdd, tsx, nupC, and nupG
MKDTTIEDVAEHAGVSKSTVSAVINDRDVVKDTTRQRVLDAIETLNYRPRGSARRGFKSPSGQSLGFVIKEADNPYYSEIQVGIQEVASEHGYMTFVSSSEGRFDDEKRIVKQFSNKDLDGLIITPILNEDTDLSHIFDLQRNNIPFVLLEGVRGIQAHLVDIDNVEASSNAVQHLIELGHERIVHFAGPKYSKHSDERIEGVRRAFSRSPLIFSDEYAVRVGDSFEAGYERALEYFPEKGSSADEDMPTAVTCYNDLVALGVMRALREQGWDVPEEISVVGFDDLNLLDYVSTPLTTIHVPKRKMGRKAAELLLRQIQGNGANTSQRISLDAELVVRSSTAPPSG